MKPDDLKCPFKWDERLVLLEDNVLYVPDHFDQYDQFTFPGWEALFGNQKPVKVEYCSGNGTWVAEKARSDASCNWVAIEKKFVRVRKIWSKIKNLQLNQLLAICGEGFKVTKHYFPSDSVDEIYINFPDPWPKKRHIKHRIIQPEFVEEMRRILKNEGKLIFVTDDADYSEWFLNEMKANPGFTNCNASPGYLTEWEGYGSSYFDSLWREKGKVIRYHQFKKDDKSCFQSFVCTTVGRSS